MALKLRHCEPTTQAFGPGTRRRKNKGLRIYSVRGAAGFVAIQWESPAPQQSKVALRARFITGLPRFARNDDAVK